MKATKGRANQLFRNGLFICPFICPFILADFQLVKNNLLTCLFAYLSALLSAQMNALLARVLLPNAILMVSILTKSLIV